ncbi:hypothetical protein CL618_02375 [archaeon]|nr:hypothetical protein [archaeon]|tara:strand:- start:1950 stop:2897 length:948 start_codon:yes stop_codon:yes gene_type:complete
MFTAVTDDGTEYTSGRLSTLNPKSLDLLCPDCNAPVSHYKRHRKGLNVMVAEHFKHRPGDYPEHPSRSFTWQKGNIMDALLTNFSDLDVETDRTSVKDLSFLVDMYLPEQRTAIFVESDSFSFQDFHEQTRTLSSREIATLLVLSAQGEENKKGKYFRDANRKNSPSELKTIKGTEKEVHKLLGTNTYFDHDDQSFISTDYTDFEEELTNPCHDCRKSMSQCTGEDLDCNRYKYTYHVPAIQEGRTTRTFTDYKFPENPQTYTNFDITPIRLPNGLWIASLEERKPETVKAIEKPTNPESLKNMRTKPKQLTLPQ